MLDKQILRNLLIDKLQLNISVETLKLRDELQPDGPNICSTFD